MSVNTMDFNQIATVLADITSQVTGTQAIAATNTSDWISQAQVALKAGYEPVLNAISQIISKTIYSMRPYNRKFNGLKVDSQRFGAITRKLVVADKPFEDDKQFQLVDGQSIDHYIVNKPLVLETRFYGFNTVMKTMTIFKDQLDSAFQNPTALGELMSMLTQNVQDMIEQEHESMARMTLAGLAGGIQASVTAGVRDADNIVHLLTEYNQLSGQNLSDTDVYQAANFKPFMQFVYSRVAALSQLMTERSSLFQTRITGYNINRHTPVPDQLVYLYAPARYQFEMMAIADTFHDNYLTMAETESVNFWQSITTPDTINVDPSYIDNSGAVVDTTGVTVSPLFGIIADRDALGYTVVNEWNAVSPLNISGGYWNSAWHLQQKYWIDLSEKALLLVLD